MILITLGTQDKSFKRLLEKIDELIDKKVINDEVVVQAGYTKYESKNMRIFDLLDRLEFEKLLEKSDLLITHGGVGSILTGLKNNKKVIAVARLSKYNEHTNDHQIQIVNEFGNLNYIKAVINLDDLEDIIKNIDKFKPNKFISNNKNFVEFLKNYIDNN